MIVRLTFVLIKWYEKYDIAEIIMNENSIESSKIALSKS